VRLPLARPPPGVLRNLQFIIFPMSQSGSERRRDFGCARPARVRGQYVDDLVLPDGLARAVILRRAPIAPPHQMRVDAAASAQDRWRHWGASSPRGTWPGGSAAASASQALHAAAGIQPLSKRHC